LLQLLQQQSLDELSQDTGEPAGLPLQWREALYDGFEQVVNSRKRSQ
jgi:hypothetical protein